MVEFFLNHPMVDIPGTPRWEPARSVPAAPPPAERPVRNMPPVERPVREPPPPPPLRFATPEPDSPSRLKRMGGLLKHLWRRIRAK
jgi:hypothetical protein